MSPVPFRKQHNMGLRFVGSRLPRFGLRCTRMFNSIVALDVLE